MPCVLWLIVHTCIMYIYIIYVAMVTACLRFCICTSSILNIAHVQCICTCIILRVYTCMNELKLHYNVYVHLHAHCLVYQHIGIH